MSDLIEMDSAILSFEKNYDYNEIFGGMAMATDNTTAAATTPPPPPPIMDWAAIMEDEKNLKNDLKNRVPFVGLRHINQRQHTLPQIRQPQHNFRHKVQSNNNCDNDTQNNGRYCRGMKGDRKWVKPAPYLYLEEFIRYPNAIIFMVDIQTICKEISEITIYTPSMPVYNRHYKLIETDNVENAKLKEHNIRYTGWSERAQKTGLNYPGDNRHDIFEKFRNFRDVVFIVRGNPKRKLLMKIVHQYRIDGIFYTFPDYFKNNNVCDLHDNSAASCSVANVQQMISYYTGDDTVLSHLFCTDL